jgi:metallo-beta-lactamase family protein
VHGEYDVQKAFQQRLMKKGFMDVIVPEQHKVQGVVATD